LIKEDKLFSQYQPLYQLKQKLKAISKQGEEARRTDYLFGERIYQVRLL
jgi:hypothetical protein